jgi:transglutaminase-like putative cysteine protease
MLVAARRRDVALLQGDPILQWADKIKDEANQEMATFLNLLTDAIYKKFTVIYRENGPSWPPTTTFEFGRGACRDLAVLFVDACRAVGLAARFVSGYQEGDPNQDQRDLHAWAEVYIPDAGWRGYDPTHGLAVADRHVAVAASAEPAFAAPLVGTFRGTGVKTEFHSHVQIQVGESAATMVQVMGL